MVYATSGLLDVLLDMAADAEPEPLSVVLGSTPAEAFEPSLDFDSEVDPSSPVLTHFYHPDAARSVNAVFGVDLGVPPGRGRARFVSHPQGPRSPTRRDDFAAAVLLAVPPWEEVAAFGRHGNRLELTELDAEPPRDELQS